jgi:GntR family transcriptional regulator
MQLHIATGSELPIYRQIMRQITDAIAGGRLRPGDKLTSQRDLAVQLVIAPLTVKKAYDELEREGLIRTERGRGTFVAAGAPAIDRGEQLERLREMARRLLSRAHLIGVPLPELVALIEEAEAELAAERSANREEPRLDHD